MEPKEVPKMVEMAKNHISTIPKLDSLVLRENSTDCTVARSEMNMGFDCSPVNAPKHTSQPSNPTFTAQTVAVQVTENNKAEETVSAEAKPMKTGADEAAHKMKITDQTSLDTNNFPTFDAGNDQVTVEQSCQLLLESAGSMKPPAASSAAASESLTKPVSVVVIDAKSPMRADTTLKAFVDVKPESSAPTPTPVPSMSCMIMRTNDDPTAVDDSLQRLRAPLAETYAPYIHPSDTSLKDARDRLHKALEQTRQLRESFTDRVYKKYRVCLRPVPKSIDAIINPIVADPAAVSRKLEEDIHQIKEEKEIEKKEAQKLATLKAPVGPDGAPLAHALASAAETAEQLAFITSGLSLVILPEDDDDENETDLSDYKYRGPFNLETGQRVGGISAAAGAAAEALLDRVRRGAAMRIERQRRRQLRLLAGETSEMDTTSIMFPSSLHLLSSSDPARRIPERTPPSAKAAKGLHGTRVSLPFPSSSGSKSNRASLSSGALLSLNTSSEDLKSDGKPCAATAALISRGVGVTRPIQQRWRHPHPESPGGRGVMLGTATSDKKCYASDPFDTYVGEPTIPEYITRSLPPLRNQKSWTQVKPVKVLDVPLAGTDRARTAVQAALGQFLEPGEPLAECKKAAIESNTDEKNKTSKEDAPRVTGVSGEMPCVEADTAETSSKDVCKKAALDSSYDERKETSTTDAPMVTVGTDASGESLSAAADTTDPSQINAACNVTSSLNKRRTRCATEIDLLHAMQYTPEQETKQMTETQVVKANASREVGAEVASDKVTDSLASSLTGQSPEDAEVAALPIQPMLAFSVMHALGLVKEAGIEKADESAERKLSLIDASVFQDKIEDTDMIADDKDKANLKDLMKKNSSRKRSFTDIFLSDALLQVRASNSVGKASFSRSRDRMDGEKTSGESFAKKPRRDQEGEQCGNEIRPATSRTEECPVLAIRGGGEEVVDGSDDGIRTEEEVAKPSRRLHRRDRVDSDGVRAKVERSRTPGSPDLRPSRSPMSPSGHESSLHNQALLVDLAQQQLSLLHPQHRVNGSDVLYAPDFSPPRSSASPALSSIDRNAALRHQYANLHDSSAHALQLAHNTLAMNRLSASHAHQFSGDFSDYFGVQLPTHHSSGYGSHADWSSLSTASAAAAGCLPVHSTLASIGLDPHLGLSVRDRARVLFAREQEHNAAVVAHAAAARRHASTVQAAAFMSASQGDLYAHSTGASSHFLRVGGHYAPPVDSGLTGAFVGSPGRRIAKSKKPSKKDSGVLSSPGRQRKPPPKTSPSCGSLLKGQSGAEGAESSEDRNVGAEPVDQKSKSEESPSRNSATNAPRFPEAIVNVSSEKEDSSNTLELERRSGVYRGVRNPTVAATLGKMTGKQPPEQKISSEAPTETNNSELSLFSAEEPSSTPLATSGMQFFLPVAPADLPDEVSNLIVTARFHIALVDEASSLEGSTLIEYLLAVGGAVPIPKALISNPLKERLNTPGFKSHSNNAAPSVPREVRCSNSAASSVPREVVVATILVWLWAQNKTSFQRAFAKSGRIDVDPECKWLIHTAVDASVRALMLDIADAVARGGSMASALGGGRNKGSTNAEKAGGQVSASESDRQSGSSTSVDVHVASIVSQALMAQFCIDEGVDEALPYYSDLVQLLDEARLCALRTKCRERALVAALISRNATISEQFSHAYVSAMVRAGEALGHEELFELVQDEDTLTSTMIPYDIFTDESGAWEDPCRAKDEFAANLTGDDLMRRAHARAMIQKSLKKLQDRHSIRGGAPVAGPYADPPPDFNASGAGPAAGVERPQYQRTPSDSLKRKASFSMASESSFDRGTGVTVAPSMALYNPRHYSAPLFWDADNVENTPYGKHMKGFRQRSFSLGRQSFSEDADDSESTGRSKKRLQISRADSVSISCPPTDEDSLSLPRSTQEVAWVDVAQIFKPVALAGPTTPTARLGDDEEPETSARTIIAPFCRKVERPPAMSDDEGLEEEEDISDEAVLARHRVVLDRMKQKLDKVMEARQQGQQRDRNRSTMGT